jgi:F0F1-type ATP synthase assembly protein I
LSPLDKPDDRSALVQAMSLSSMVMGVAMEMVLPGLAGWYFLDRRLGTKVVFLVLGLVVGVVGGMIHLVRMLSPKNSASGKKPGGRGRPPAGVS